MRKIQKTPVMSGAPDTEPSQKHRPGVKKAKAPRQDLYINFPAIARIALARMPGLIFDLLPGGTLRGSEYTVLNPSRADNSTGSFKINIRTGRWADFAVSGARGGDIVSLVAYLHGMSQPEAAMFLLSRLGGRR